MACLLKLPRDASKGVVTFTTQEWRIMKADEEMNRLLKDLRSLYVIGLHFNWHDDHFIPPDEFDFFMAGEEDLKPASDKPFDLLPMDACNFTQASYQPAPFPAKHWDVLVVGNPVYFKRPDVVLKTIRTLFDRTERPLRVLYICPIPVHRFLNEDTVFYDVRAYYEALFTAEERTRFTLLTTEFDSPNPFDRNTLSVFFQMSKVFLHCATEERRCRIAAYAWCAGLPVIAYPSVASILPSDLRKKPGYFAVTKDDEYAPQILDALTAAETFDAQPYQHELSEIFAVSTLERRLAALFEAQNIPFEGPLLKANLDRRLGWHHAGIGGVSNGLTHPLPAFMQALTRMGEYDLSARQQLTEAAYPERVIAGEIQTVDPAKVESVERRSIYLNPKRRRLLGLARHIGAKLRIL